MRNISLEIAGLKETETQKRVTKQIEALNGVEDVQVSMDEKSVEITYNWPATDTEIYSHLQNNGYKIK